MAKTQVITDDVLTNLDNYAGLPIMGFTTMWRASGVEVNHTTIVELLKRQSFEQFVPPMPTIKKALRRAIVEWLKLRAKGSSNGLTVPILDDDTAGIDVVKRALIRPINQSKSKIMAYTIVREDVDLTEYGLEHDTALRFLLNKDSGDLAVTTRDEAPEVAFANKGLDPLGALIEKELSPIWDIYREMHTTADILLAVREIVLGSMSFSLRREGGVYFIPDSKRAVVLGLHAFFDELNAVCPKGTATLTALPQIDIGGARSQLSVAAHAAMLDELAAMETYLDDAFVNAKPGSVKPASIAKQINLFKEKRAKLDAYRELLGMRGDEVASKIDALTEKARDVVTKAVEAANAEEEGEQEGGEAAADA